MLARKHCVKPEFQISHLTPNKFFTQDYNQVTGNITLNVTNPLQDIISIEIGLRGSCLTRFQESYNLGNLANDQHHKHTTPLFNQSNVVYQSPAAVCAVPGQVTAAVAAPIAPGSVFHFPFQFEFPRGFALPSSCDRVGENRDDKGYLSVSYQVYARFNYRSLISSTGDYFEFTTLLNYQGGSNVGNSGIGSGVRRAYFETVFTGKSKVLVVDETSDQLVENQVKSGKKNSRALRSLFNDKYKKQNIGKFVKDVAIRMALDVPQLLNIAGPLDSITVTFEFPGIAELEPDFAYKGKSTRLGCFKVESVWFKLIQDLTIHSEGFTYQTTKRNRLFKFNDINKEFDLATFTYNQELQAYCYTISLGELVGTGASIMSILTAPVMGDFNMAGVFSNSNTLAVNIEISDAQTTNSHSKKAKFHVHTQLDCSLITTPQYISQYQVDVPLGVNDSQIVAAVPPPLAPRPTYS
ncbi:unnamed protein product [Ambrosiozyma monospora]|uniref:Unnamed protein product n=1 Tax=Ambrosiozyma monospora TaxID=43982 RepID=A0A9W7DET6_AMBMO|nr:unnamed protein product [Ambrosiozyma monospora]